MSDTSPDIEKRFAAMTAAKTPAERLRMASRMFDTGRALLIAGLKRQKPDLSEAQLQARVFLRLYGKDFTSAEIIQIASSIGLEINLTPTDQQLKAIHQIAGKYGLKLLLLFGSAVTGKAHHASDIDVAALFPSFQEGRKKIIDLAVDLQEVFPEREVDIALINGADPFFLKKILENRQLLYGEPRRLAELEMYAYKRYIDHKRYLLLEKEYVHGFLERIKKGAA